jgi:hypothetical protein
MDHSKSSSGSSNRSALEGVVRHSCRRCSQILFYVPESRPQQEFNFVYDDVLSYARDGCDLFASRIIAHNFEDFGSSELQFLRLRVQIRWRKKPYNGFHFIIFEWFKHDKFVVFSSNTLDEGDEFDDRLHVFAIQGTMILRYCRKLANSLILDSSASNYINTRPLNESPGSMVSIGWVQHQLQHCKERHEKCRKQRSLTLSMPTRLIAVESSGNIDVHLEELAGGKTESYVALSYCWGSGQENIMTTRANLLERLQKISFETLPKTIKDAIIVTRKLKYKYLWVDALCIVQDNEEDRAQEVSKMSQVYTGASLTISAAMADNSEQGFLQDRDLIRSYGTIFELPFQVKGDERGEAHILLHQNSVQNKREEVIDRRGWTLQEHQLACRLLRYGSNQIEWNCQEQISVDGGCQCRETGIYPVFFKGLVEEYSDQYKAENLDEIFRLRCRDNWITLVEDYSHRSLSKLSDKLPAFAAIAENFAQTMKLDASDYCAGLWRSDMQIQLLWQRDTTQTPSAEKGSGTERHTETPGPSWSWASLRDSIIFECDQRSYYPKHTLEVVECGIEPKTPGYRYGEVQSARLTVHGYVKQARWTGHLFREVISDDSCGSSSVLPIHAVWDSSVEASPGFYWCLEISLRAIYPGSCGIILTAIDCQSFKRVGYFKYGHYRLESKVLEQLFERRSFSRLGWLHT